MNPKLKNALRSDVVKCLHLPLAALMVISFLLLSACGGEQSGGGGGGNGNPPPPSGGNNCSNNNQPQCATRLLGNNPFLTEIVNSATDEFDFLRYAPTQSGEATVRLFGFGANDLDLELRSAANQFIDGSGSASLPEEQVVIQVMAGRVYYILVHAFETGGNNTNYSLAVTLRSVSGPPPTATMNFGITDSCDDGRAIRFKFYDKDNNLVWPNPNSHFTTRGLGQASRSALSCVAGARICYGASTQADGSGNYWGVGLFGDKGCTNCCYQCVHGSSVGANLVCQ